MRYQRKSKKNNRELALEALEILEKEGIEVSEIAPRRKFNGERRFILLKEVRDERIGAIIEKYNLDPNLSLGMQIDTMRKKVERFDEVERNRILKLGIKKHEKPLDQQSRPFRNQIQETLYILEQLKSEGIDIPFIPQSIKGGTSHLIDIDCPKIQGIIRQLGLKPDFPIGVKMRTIAQEYHGQKNDYHFEEKERKRVDELGFLNDTEKNVQQTIEILELLQNNGIDIASASSDITLKSGETRRRYACEIESDNIEQVLEQLQIPKYLVIGKRIDQVMRYIYKDGFEQENRDTVKEKLKELGIMQYRTEIDEQKTLEILAELEKRGVKTITLPTFRSEFTPVTLGDLNIENIDEIIEKLGVEYEFPIGKGISKICRIYSDKSYQRNDKLSDRERKQIEEYASARQKEKDKTAVRETIKLIERLSTYGVDINTVSLRPIKDGEQTTTILSDLPLNEDELESIKAEFEIDDDFPLGNRIINIRQAYKEKNRIALTPEDREGLERVGLVDERKTGIKDKNDKRIEMFSMLSSLGIDVASFKATYSLNGKSEKVQLGMLELDEEKIAQFKEKFGVDEGFKIGGCKQTLRKAYRDGKLSEEQIAQIESLGIIDELDKLEVEQKQLEEKLREAKQLKAQALNQRNKNESKNLGE